MRLFVVKQNRRNATLQLLKRAVDEGRFGRIYMVAINVFWSRPQSYYDSAAWRGTWEFDGGAFMNQASHYIDLLDWLIGPVESVQAYTATLARDIEVEDTGVMSVRWRSGTLGTVSVTMLAYPKNFEGSITILGEKGTVRVGGVAVNEIQHWEFAEPHADDETVKKASYETTSVYGFGHPLYYDNVIKVLRGEAEPETDGRGGPEVARGADRDLSVGAGRPAGRAAARLLSPGSAMKVEAASSIHPTAIVDPGAADRRRDPHLALGSRLRRRADRSQLLARPERLRRQQGRDRRQREDPEQRLGLRQRDAGRRRVLRPEHGLHERVQPALGGVAQERVSGHARRGAARRSAPIARSSAA